MKREPQSDRAEIEHGEGSGMAEWEGETPASLWNVNMETHLFLFGSIFRLFKKIYLKKNSYSNSDNSDLSFWLLLFFFLNSEVHVLVELKVITANCSCLDL